MNIKKFKRGDNRSLTKNFHLSEMECKCGKCNETIVDMDHIEKLQELRERLNYSINITSGYRCKEHNKKIGGVEKSQHLLGTATDIQCSSYPPRQLQEECESFNGLGRYKTFTHIDSRNYKARWGTTPDIPEEKASPDFLPDGPSEKEIKNKLKGAE